MSVFWLDVALELYINCNIGGNWIKGKRDFSVLFL